MDSKIFTALCLVLLLSGCFGWGDSSGAPTPVPEPAHDKGYADDSSIGYWYQKHITADNTPDIIKSQDILEKDLAACGYEVRARNHWARVNNPVSTPDGHVVDSKGTAREDTPLPTTYELSGCMERKGWVRLKHYYTTPY